MPHSSPSPSTAELATELDQCPHCLQLHTRELVIHCVVCDEPSCIYCSIEETTSSLRICPGCDDREPSTEPPARRPH